MAERNVVCSPDANRRISHPTSKRMPRHYSLSLSLSISLSLSHEAASVVLRINTGNGMESKASFVDGLLLRAPLSLLISLPGPFAV